MNNLLILIPIALGLGIAGLLAFVWSLKSGQFDDLDGAAERILEDDPLENGGKSMPRHPDQINPG
ncbi:MAG: cbb3-type cytochrome oxidase assembly protein CcoS [Rhizobiaceae bacterium]